MSVVLPVIALALAGSGAFFLAAFGYAQLAKLVRAAETVPRTRSERTGLGAALRFFSERMAPHLPGKLTHDLTLQITRAGGLGGMTPAQVVLSALLTSALGLTLGVMVVMVTGWSPAVVLMVALLASVMPFIWLRDQVKRRHDEILSDLPYHLDLLTLSVEAGLDFGAAVARMVDKGRPGALREEFNAFLGEMRIGKTRSEALESMAERVGLEQLSTFLAALIQADRMGSGLGRALRLQAEQLRVERFQRAEKLAGEAPVKMLIPLVLFIFPTIWIILGAPLVFEWIFK